MLLTTVIGPYGLTLQYTPACVLKGAFPDLPNTTTLLPFESFTYASPAVDHLIEVDCIFPNQLSAASLVSCRY